MPVTQAFIARQLDYLQNLVVETEFPAYSMANGDIISPTSELPAGAKTYTYSLYNVVGAAKIITNGADDLPEASVAMDERTGYIRTIANKYSYTVEDLENAQFAGMNLDSAKAVAAREVMEATLNQIGFDGASEYNLQGLLNHPNVDEITILNDGNSNGGTASTRWIHKTAAQVMRDLRQIAAYCRTTTNYVESPTEILLPIEQFEVANNLLFSQERTVLEFFLETEARVPGGIRSVRPIPYLAGKGPAGSGIAIALNAAPNKIRFHIPMDFTPEAVQMRDFNFSVPCRMKTAGIQLLKPKSMVYAKGI